MVFYCYRALAVAGWLACAASGSAAQPTNVIVEPAALDFKCVTAQEQYHRTLRLRNDGDRTLRFTTTDSDCVCLRSTLASDILTPGETAEWLVELNTCRKQGEFHRHVYLRSNEPDRLVVHIPVHYHVVPELFAQPESVNLGIVAPDATEPIDTLISIRTVTNNHFQLLDVRTNDPAIDGWIEEASVSKDTPGSVLIRAYPPLPEGRIDPTVWIVTDSGKVRELRIPVNGESIAGVQCEPREIVFDSIPFGSTPIQTVTITHDTNVRIGEIRIPGDTVGLAGVEREARRVVLKVRVKPDTPLGTLSGDILIQVHHQGVQKIRVPYRGQVVEPAVVAPVDEQTAVTPRTATTSEIATEHEE